MRAILIDPTERTLDEVDLPDLVAEIRREFGGAKPIRVATLPNSGCVHVVLTDHANEDTFSLGGSRPHRGLGLILARRGL
jgi:hypothetical protein